MGLFGLPGEAAVPLVLGNLLNLYAAIGAILAMELTVKQVFTLALMLGFSHMLPVESAICRRVGVSVLLVVGFRLGLAAAAGLAVAWLWDGGRQRARYGLAAPAAEEPSGWGEALFDALRTAAEGILQLALIVVPVMFLIQILRDLGALQRFAALMRPLMRPLGIAPAGRSPWPAGSSSGSPSGPASSWSRRASSASAAGRSRSSPCSCAPATRSSRTP